MCMQLWSCLQDKFLLTETTKVNLDVTQFVRSSFSSTSPSTFYFMLLCPLWLCTALWWICVVLYLLWKGTSHEQMFFESVLKGLGGQAITEYTERVCSHWHWWTVIFFSTQPAALVASGTQANLPEVPLGGKAVSPFYSGLAEPGSLACPQADSLEGVCPVEQTLALRDSMPTFIN